MRYTVYCNGVPIADMTAALLLDDSVGAYECRIIGNGRYIYSNTYIRLSFYNMQQIDADLVSGIVMLTIEHMPVGNPTPIVICRGDWPQGPTAVLHWTKHNRVYENGINRTEEYERFSLIAERSI